MHYETRTQNSVRNIIFGVSGQLLIIILRFINQLVFIQVLGVTYLGINGLFTNILSMLSLADLGISTAIIQSMYKPLAINDKNKLKAIMKFYEKAYRVIGFGVAIIGICLIPFLNFFIKDNIDIQNLITIYLLFLTNSVLTYFFAYKQSIIIADQKFHITSIYRSIFSTIQTLSQIIILFFTGDFILYLVIQIICTLLNNLLLSRKADKIYPFLKERGVDKLDKKSTKEIYEKIRALVLFRIGGVILNGSNNIIISLTLGVYWVGLISNYTLIISSVSILIFQIFTSIAASLGNFNTTESNEKKEYMYNSLNFLNFWLLGICSICFWNLSNTFIHLWIGENFLIKDSILFILIVNFYVIGYQSGSVIFRETIGLFSEMRYIPLIASIINIVMSLLLVNYMGISGIFLATIISRLLTFTWYEPYKMYKVVFKKNVLTHYYNYIWYFSVMVLTGYFTTFLAKNITGISYLTLLGKGFICLLIPNLLFYFIFRKTKEFKYLKEIIKTYLMPKVLKVQALKRIKSEY